MGLGHSTEHSLQSSASKCSRVRSLKLCHEAVTVLCECIKEETGLGRLRDCPSSQNWHSPPALLCCLSAGISYCEESGPNPTVSKGVDGWETLT